MLVLPPLLLSAPFPDWLYRAFVLLVIACSCALVISTPVSIVAGLEAAARQGAVTLDGEGEVVVGIVLQLRGANTKNVIEGVRPKVEDTQEALPEGVRIVPDELRREPSGSSRWGGRGKQFAYAAEVIAPSPSRYSSPAYL